MQLVSSVKVELMLLALCPWVCGWVSGGLPCWQRSPQTYMLSLWSCGGDAHLLSLPRAGAACGALWAWLLVFLLCLGVCCVTSTQPVTLFWLCLCHACVRVCGCGCGCVQCCPSPSTAPSCGDPMLLTDFAVSVCVYSVSCLFCEPSGMHVVLSCFRVFGCVPIHF